MIRFLYGAGSLASAQILENAIREALDNGDNAILLVPEQETVNTERRMVRALPAGAQLNFEVLNFTRLANRVFRTVGGLCHGNVTPAAEVLLLYRSLRELSPVLLQYGEKTAKNPRFCEKLLAAKAGLGASLISPENLLDIADKTDSKDPFHKKMQDLGTVFSVHERYLDTCFGNHRDDLGKLPEALRKHGKTLFESTHIFMDSFTDFTGQELEIIQELFAAAKAVTVTLPTGAPGEEGLQFYSAARTEKKLRRFAAACGKRVFFEPELTKKPQDALRFLRKNLFDMTADPAPLAFAASAQITLTRCQNPLAEAEHAATVIHRLVRGGARYRDIAVVARDATAYAGIIDATLEKEGIPCFLSEKTDLAAKPLLKLILSALRILRFGYRCEDVVEYLKTGLCGVHRDEVSFFEEYLGVWNFRGKSAYTSPFTRNPEGLSKKRTARGEKILATAESVRETFLPPLLRFEKELSEAEHVRDQIAAIAHLMSALGVSAQLKEEAARRLASGERREAEELARLFSVTMQTLETAATVLGEDTYTIEELQDALQLAFLHTDIGTIPTSADEVTVGSASMLRADHPRFVIVLGLTEGSFPQSVQENGIFTGKERRQLAEYGFELAGDTDSAASDELFYVWRSFTAPRERLWLSYPGATLSGKATTPSIAITRVRALFPGLTEECYEAAPPTERMFTLTGAEEHFAECGPGERAVLARLLKEFLPGSPVLGATPISDADATIPAALAERLFAHREMSPSQLEKYAGCRFAYYCAHILHLREEADDSFSDAEVGNYIHFVLEKAIAKLRAPGNQPPTDQQIDTLVEEISGEYRAQLAGAAGEFSPRASALLTRLKLLAGIVVRGLSAELSDSLFAPAFLELNLKNCGEVPHVTLKNGAKLPLSGTADRVDFWKSANGNAYFRVVDYKTGEHRFDPELVRRGGAMQMPLYLLALCKNAHPALCRTLGLPDGTPFLPAGITYLTVGVRSATTPFETNRETALSAAVERITRSGVLLDREEVKHALSLSADPAILGHVSRSGKGKDPFLDEAGFEQLFDDLTAAVGDLTDCMKEGLADAHPRVYAKRAPCEYCRFGAVCRAAQKNKGGNHAIYRKATACLSHAGPFSAGFRRGRLRQDRGTDEAHH